MQDLSDWSRLDAAAYRVSVKRSVRRVGWFAAIVGLVVAACGLAAGLVPLVPVGLILAAAGAWNVSRPSIHGLVVDGAAMGLTGLFNSLVWLWIEEARGPGAGKWILAGMLQMGWSARRLALYRSARRAANDPEAISRLESIVRELSRRRARHDPEIAEFRTGRVLGRRNRLGLYAEGAIAVLDHWVVRLERRADIWIEARGTTSMGRTIKVRVQMGNLELEGEMPTVHFERFERWKLGMLQAPSIAA